VQENKCSGFQTASTPSTVTDQFPNNDTRNSDIEGSTNTGSHDSSDTEISTGIAIHTEIDSMITQLQTFTDDELEIYLRIISTYVVLR
jgi:hypothetical protein